MLNAMVVGSKPHLQKTWKGNSSTETKMSQGKLSSLLSNVKCTAIQKLEEGNLNLATTWTLCYWREVWKNLLNNACNPPERLFSCTSKALHLCRYSPWVCNGIGVKNVSCGSGLCCVLCSWHESIEAACWRKPQNCRIPLALGQRAFSKTPLSRLTELKNFNSATRVTHLNLVRLPPSQLVSKYLANSNDTPVTEEQAQPNAACPCDNMTSSMRYCRFTSTSSYLYLDL